MRKSGRVREPVQVYLDLHDRAILQELVRRTSLSQAELLRRGLRRLSADLLAERRPGASLDEVIGVLGGADVPSDLAARHDDYLFDEPDARASGGD
jgi:hypothetical protein